MIRGLTAPLVVFFLWLTDLQLAVQGNVIQHDIETAVTIFKGCANAGPVIFTLVLVNSVNGQILSGHSFFLLQQADVPDSLRSAGGEV
jgi:hypothetical protein